jgi:hypothetical protein
MARLPSFNEALALATAGAAAASPRGRRAALRVGRTGVRLTTAIARRHPAIATAVVLAELGYIFEEDIREVAQDLRQRMPSPASGQGGSPTFSGESVAPKVKRKLSKANKAMKQAMKATKNNFKQATKIASKANPATKSKIGKGTSTVKKLARKIRKSVWGSLRRKK